MRTRTIARPPGGQVERQGRRAHKAAPIAAIFGECLQSFEQLRTIIETNQEAEKNQSLTFEGAFSKFCQWGSDTAAPKHLLDHALRRAPQLQQVTERLLKDLLFTLSTTLEATQNVDIPQASPMTDYFSQPSELDSSGQLSPSKASSESDSSLQQLSDDIEECVDCLIKLVPAFKDPAPHDIHPDNASHGEVNEDINVAKEMFPTANLSFLRRLGFANWRRKQILWSLKLGDNANALPKQISRPEVPPDLGVQQSDGSSIKISGGQIAFSTNAQSFPSPGSSHTGSVSVESIFSKKIDYWNSRSATSVAGSEETPRIKRLNVPKAPITLKPGATFDCPYCGQEIVFGVQLGSNEDWNDHVYLDLEPYMCTFDNCLRADRTFGNREDWVQHELDHHRLRKFWFCQSCSQDFEEAKDIELHLSELHNLANDPKQLSLMVSLCEKYSDDGIGSQPCLFCGSRSETRQALEDHIADHMEQFSLTSVQTVYGLETSGHADFLEKQLAEKAAKLEDLNKFVKDQSGNFWKPQQGFREDDSESSHIEFADDSEDEIVDRDVILPTTMPEVVGSNKRPSLNRRGDSWMKKINVLLRDRTPDQPYEEHLQPKIESPRETNPIEDYQPLQNVSNCLRTKSPPKNKDFIGRHSDFVRLRERLSQPGSCLVMSGVGGMGKTETAIEYTYRYEKDYSYIFWISAETPMSCADTYTRIATEFIVPDDNALYGQDRLISLGREFLEQSKMRWLLIFDNVNSWSDIEQYIPMQYQTTSGSILITARTPDVIDPIDLPGCHFLELKALTLEESRFFLLNSMKMDFDIDKVESHPEYSLAGVIAKESEGLPLALSHIAGYLQVSECTLTDFVQLWNEHRRHKSQSTSVAGSTALTHKSLETVWNIGLREVTADAQELLNILAFLDGDHIQRNLLVDKHEEPSLKFLHSDQPFRYKRMIRELSRRNIISVNAENGEESLRIHRSLQQKILENLNSKGHDKLEAVFIQAYELIRKKFPLPSPIQVPEPAKWPACKEYLSHVRRLENVVTTALPSIAPSVRLAQLFSDGGINLWERGMTSEGLRLLKSAEAILDRLESDESLLRANIHVIINLLIQDFGLSHYEESKDRIRKALKIRLNHMLHSNPKHYARTDAILLHNAWSDYGCVLLQYNEYQRAEPMFRKCLIKYIDWGTEAELPYEYYKYNHHVAFCRLYQGDFAGAIELAEKSLRLIILATGESSAASKTRFDLASIVLQSGDTLRALALHRQVLASNERQHGKFNFLTLQSYYSVGVVTAHTGNLVEAEHWMKKALALAQSRKESWSEVANARTEFCLSQILNERGKEPDLARQLESQARSVLARLLPLNPLDGVEPGDDIALFDHLQPVFDGRFAGRTLLKYVSKKA